MSNIGFTKRQKERNRKDKQVEKAAKRAAKRAEKADRPKGAGPEIDFDGGPGSLGPAPDIFTT
jgi:hypothetical protein